MPGTPEQPAQTAKVESAQTLEMASILFLDIVKYSVKPMDQQERVLTELQQIVRASEQFKIASNSNSLLSLPTGDGMALVFFHDPVAPVNCALEIANALKDYSSFELRMGVHGGPVYRHADIRDELNVVGGGINIAQRVMDCGDAGHILVSAAVADVLRQLSGWAEHLQDLGECTVKHGASVHLYNLFTGNAGNPVVPTKLRAENPADVRPIILRLAGYCLAPVTITFALRAFFNMSPVTRDRPLTPRETLAVFLALLIATAVLLWLKRWVIKRFKS